MKKLICLLFISFVSLITFAQSNDAIIKKLLEKQIITEEEATDLLNDKTEQTSTSAKIEQVTDILNNRYLKIGGYAQFLFSYNSMNKVKDDLSVRNAFISLGGNPVGNLNYFMMYNFKNNVFTEGYVTWTPFKSIGARIGQMKIPLGIENNMSMSKIEFIQNTLMMEYFLGGSKDVLAKQNGKNSAGRDIGAILLGSVINYKNSTLIDYVVGAYQGGGINNSSPRNSKDFTMNMFLKPIEGLRVGGGAYFGMAEYAKATGESVGTYNRNRWITSVEYKKIDKLIVRSEYTRAYDSNVQGEGGYVMGMYRFLPKFDGGVQLEYLRQNIDMSAHQNNYTGGVNFYMNKYAKLMLNYTYSDYSRQVAKNNQRVEMQFVVAY